jgi:hypothetical protein
MAQPAPAARQCTGLLTGVLIRHRVPLTETLTADLTAVVTSREAALLEYLADRARSRVEQVLVHSVRSTGFRDRLNNAATWLSRAATRRGTPRHAATRSDKDVAERQRACSGCAGRGPRQSTAAERPDREAERESA